MKTEHGDQDAMNENDDQPASIQSHLDTSTTSGSTNSSSSSTKTERGSIGHGSTRGSTTPDDQTMKDEERVEEHSSDSDSAAAAARHKRRRTVGTITEPEYIGYPYQPVTPSNILDTLAASAASSASSPSLLPMSLPLSCSSVTSSTPLSPRRALVCQSLERAALASSLATSSAIHPAILQSLSVRLQAMNEQDADIVLQRLVALVKHLETQAARGIAADQNLQKRMLIQRLQHSARSHSERSPQPNQPRPPSSNLPSSPVPPLSGGSSVASGENTSNTTSPTISPAGRAITPSLPPSPALHTIMHGTTSKSNSPHTSNIHAHIQHPSHADHPPLHPTLPHTHPSAHATQSYLHMLRSQHAQRSPSGDAASHDGGASSASASASSPSHPPSQLVTVASGPGPSGEACTLPSSDPTPLMRSQSEDSNNVPAGLMLLIEALPGSQMQGQLQATGTGQNAGQGQAQQQQQPTPSAPQPTSAQHIKMNPGTENMGSGHVHDGTMHMAQLHHQQPHDQASFSMGEHFAPHNMSLLSAPAHLKRSTSA